MNITLGKPPDSAIAVAPDQFSATNVFVDQELTAVARDVAVQGQLFIASLVKFGFKPIGYAPWSQDPSVQTLVLVSPDRSLVLSIVDRPFLQERPDHVPLSGNFQTSGIVEMGNGSAIYRVECAVPQEGSMIEFLSRKIDELGHLPKGRSGCLEFARQQYSNANYLEAFCHEGVHNDDFMNNQPWGKVVLSDFAYRIATANLKLTPQQAAAILPEPPSAESLEAAHFLLELRGHTQNDLLCPETSSLCKKAAATIADNLAGNENHAALLEMLVEVRDALKKQGYDFSSPSLIPTALAMLKECTPTSFKAGLSEEFFGLA